uniref:Ovule protein n=1 Tax=Meloidogyne incognita TaxID=6306 RepID=A0A914LWG1_MELIC
MGSQKFFYFSLQAKSQEFYMLSARFSDYCPYPWPSLFCFSSLNMCFLPFKLSQAPSSYQTRKPFRQFLSHFYTYPSHIFTL